MSSNSQFVVALSPLITWPVTFWQPQEDGPEIEVTWPFRFKRPLSADVKRYREEKQRRLERESQDLREELATPLRALTDAQRKEVIDQLDPAIAVAVQQAPAAQLTSEQRQARLTAAFDPIAWRNAFWRGWRAQSLVDADGQPLDPDSEKDREYLLQTPGLEEAIDRAIGEMMTGARQKNSRPPLVS